MAHEPEIGYDQSIWQSGVVFLEKCSDLYWFSNRLAFSYHELCLKYIFLSDGEWKSA